MSSVADELDNSAGPSAAPLSAPVLAGITRLSAADTVRARIVLAIDHGMLSAGEQLPSDAEIAAALDVSEITARRALRSLADDGVVERRRGRAGGTFVAERAPATEDNAVEAYRADAVEVHRLIELRTLLESALVHQAALAATPEQIAALDEHVAAAAAAQNWTEYHAADERFHLGLASASGLDWAIPHYTDVLYRLYRYFIPYPIDYLHDANRDHSDIVEALRRHDPVRAVQIAQQHILVLHTTMFVGFDEPGPGTTT
ncbi:FadR/GntR family transcriptional regulator [Leifsonia poae]|uniref:FadR/GntR family transcriptional regulator n=1 Tax=Leifsonia poae TaxID=110933 RepID=UPI001CC17C69|nr:FCD domain-containing protein [Leifsonia poae]